MTIDYPATLPPVSASGVTIRQGINFVTTVPTSGRMVTQGVGTGVVPLEYEGNLKLNDEQVAQFRHWYGRDLNYGVSVYPARFAKQPQMVELGDSTNRITELRVHIYLYPPISPLRAGVTSAEFKPITRSIVRTGKELAEVSSVDKFYGGQALGVDGGCDTVEVNFLFSLNQFTDFVSWWNSSLGGGAKPFKLAQVSSGLLGDEVVRAIGGWSANFGGNMVDVALQVEVEPLKKSNLELGIEAIGGDSSGIKTMSENIWQALGKGVKL